MPVSLAWELCRCSHAPRDVRAHAAPSSGGQCHAGGRVYAFAVQCASAGGRLRNVLFCFRHGIRGPTSERVVHHNAHAAGRHEGGGHAQAAPVTSGQPAPEAYETQRSLAQGRASGQSSRLLSSTLVASPSAAVTGLCSLQLRQGGPLSRSQTHQLLQLADECAFKPAFGDMCKSARCPWYHPTASGTTRQPQGDAGSDMLPPPGAAHQQW